MKLSLAFCMLAALALFCLLALSLLGPGERRGSTLAEATADEHGAPTVPTPEPSSPEPEARAVEVEDAEREEPAADTEEPPAEPPVDERGTVSVLVVARDKTSQEPLAGVFVQLRPRPEGLSEGSGASRQGVARLRATGGPRGTHHDIQTTARSTWRGTRRCSSTYPKATSQCSSSRGPAGGRSSG